MDRRGVAGPVWAWSGLAWPGMEWKAKACMVVVWQVMARSGPARWSQVRFGVAWQGLVID